MSDGLFLQQVRAVAAEYPDIELEELIVDATAALLIRRPSRFDVLVTTNMFGDILSDEASELSGSLGLGARINAGAEVCVAQAQHGSAPDIAGRNIANPTSLILSAAMLLDWIGKRDNNTALIAGGDLITRAVDQCSITPPPAPAISAETSTPTPSPPRDHRNRPPQPLTFLPALPRRTHHDQDTHVF